MEKSEKKFQLPKQGASGSFFKTFFGSIVGKVFIGFLALFIIILSFSTFHMVDSGEVGVVTKFGAVQNEILPEGLHIINPVSTKVIPIDTRIQKIEAEATASSKDLQNVTSVVALNFYLDKEQANTIFQELGINYHKTIIQPAIQESIKSAAAAYNAEQLITKRPDVKRDVFNSLRRRLEKNNIIVTDFSIVDFNFSEEFNKAIERKQVAEQLALTAKNDLRRIQTEAEQAKTKAMGEAQANLELAKAQAESQLLLAESLNKEILQLEAIRKWDGALPVVSGEGAGEQGFFDISSLMKAKKGK